MWSCPCSPRSHGWPWLCLVSDGHRVYGSEQPCATGDWTVSEPTEHHRQPQQPSLQWLSICVSTNLYHLNSQSLQCWGWQLNSKSASSRPSLWLNQHALILLWHVRKLWKLYAQQLLVLTNEQPSGTHECEFSVIIEIYCVGSVWVIDLWKTGF